MESRRALLRSSLWATKSLHMPNTSHTFQFPMKVNNCVFNGNSYSRSLCSCSLSKKYSNISGGSSTRRDLSNVQNDPFYFSKRSYTNRNLLSLRDRGLISDIFPAKEEEFRKLCSKAPQTVYAGFDPTADSLHVGNLAILMMLLHSQRAGHKPIALV